MEYIIIIVINLIVLAILKYAFNIKIKDIKKVEEIAYNKEINKITDKLPENELICKEILKKLKNEDVKIKISEDKDQNLTYYIALSNQIILANIKDTFTRIQTIAHECLHSVQNRRTLMFNFIFSNIYNIFFFIILLLTIFKVITNPMIFLIALISLGNIYYTIRSYLETDAMTKAPYLAKEYMENTNLLSKEEIQMVIENYEELNKIGIPLTNYSLLLSVVIKNVIYCIIAAIV